MNNVERLSKAIELLAQASTLVSEVFRPDTTSNYADGAIVARFLTEKDQNTLSDISLRIDQAKNAISN